MRPTPLLFFGDSPDLRTGLARIGRDLACLASATLPEFRIGYLGRAGHGSRQLPFQQYCFPEADQWGEDHLVSVWKDFAGTDKGIIFTVWDPSRLYWFSNPAAIGGSLGAFLRSNCFERWGYFAVDHFGPGQVLTGMESNAVTAYNRPLAYTAWGAEVLTRSIGRPVDWIPHGVNLDIFRRRDRTAARMAMGFSSKDWVLGCLMTNHARKDWGLAFAIAARLRDKLPNLKFWCHVDVLDRDWNLLALVEGFKLFDCTEITFTGSKSDTELSYAYSACDATILPSLGEGFGYPIVESLACGVPVWHGSYGGGAELVDPDFRIDPVSERIETRWNSIRPVYEPGSWTEAILKWLDGDSRPGPDFYRAQVDHLDWPKLWRSCWEKWFRTSG